jgi:hypothetical protein
MARRPGKQPRRNQLATKRAAPKWDMELPAKAAAAWEKASAEEKKTALAKAEKYMSERFTYRGEKKTMHQDGAWPRVNAFYDNGKPIERVPDEVQRATTLLATFYAAGKPIDAHARSHVYAIVGPVLAPERIEAKK